MSHRRLLWGALLLLGSAPWVHACSSDDQPAAASNPDASPRSQDDGGAIDARVETAAGDDGGGDAGDSGDAGSVAPFCKSGDPTCLDRLALGAFKLPYYRSHPFGAPNAAIQNIVLTMHGNGRNADAYFATMAQLAFARDPVHTLVVAPHFQCTSDVVPNGDLYWGCTGWHDGHKALNAGSTTTSYGAIDELVKAAKAAFPSAVRVTIVGYSAGAQVVQRLIAGSVEEDATPAVKTRYVVASPGSYLYFDDRRLKVDAVCPDVAGCTIDATSFESPYYDAVACPGYNDFKYGLTNRIGYLASIADAVLPVRYVSRKVVYMVGEGDSNNTSAPTPGNADFAALDKTCPAVAEGPTGADPLVGSSFRLQRGLTYHRYITLLFGAAHRIQIVPLMVGGAPCGHDQGCFLSSTFAGDEIFGP